MFPEINQRDKARPVVYKTPPRTELYVLFYPKVREKMFNFLALVALAAVASGKSSLIRILIPKEFKKIMCYTICLTFGQQFSDKKVEPCFTFSFLITHRDT